MSRSRRGSASANTARASCASPWSKTTSGCGRPPGTLRASCPAATISRNCAAPPAPKPLSSVHPGQRPAGGAVQHPPLAIEAGAMGRAVPALLLRGPLHDAVEMRTDRAMLVQRAFVVPVDCDLCGALLQQGTLASSQALDAVDLAGAEPVLYQMRAGIDVLAREGARRLDRDPRRVVYP